ncbi:S8 family serine peptidase [Dethiothermospora halolimnae]|uniref:S8 family serine peptidase n=1 Tax=Dethiothermospora halolimnae TaxID=3114390 RepID=UPI003CCB8710
MKKLLSILLVLLMVLSTVSFANTDETSSVTTSGDTNFVEGELIISVDSSRYSIQSTTDTLSTTLEKNGFKVADYLLDLGNEKGVQVMSNELKTLAREKMGDVYLVEYPEDYNSVNGAIDKLKEVLRDSGISVRYIEPNYTVYALEDDITTNAVHSNQQWQYDMIKAPEAWTITNGSSYTKMAVLDTGIDHNHQSLENFVNTSLGRNFVGGSTTMDGHGHGTHVSGTIASYGVVSGVMQNATLIPVKVLSDSGSGSSYGIQQGILYAAEIGADVINMSLGGGGYSQATDEACQTAVQSGTIVVAASGNDGTASVSYPAAYSSVIAVGSVTSNETRSYFSNYGEGLDVVAPGSNIYSTYPGNSYNTLSGTSMASPHVAGVCGLMRAADPNISVAEVQNILKDTAQYAGSSYEYGSGIVNAYEAVLEVDGGSTPPPPEDDKTYTSVTTNYSYYYRGEDVVITATVEDENNNALSGATVEFTVTRPNGTTVSESVETNSNGEAVWTIGSSYSTSLGTYDVEAVASKSGYESSTGTTSFSFSY